MSDVNEAGVEIPPSRLLHSTCARSSPDSMTREASAFLAAVKWDEEAVEPRDFVRTQSLPQVAKSIKCHSSHENSDQNKVPLNQPILWLNVSRSTKIVAQPVKFRSSLPPIIYGPKVSLDHNLPGWFEILSEDGRTSSCMTSASEVAKRKPEKFLIRQKVKCLASSPGTSIVLQAGEVLTFVSSGSSNHPFLRCITQSGNKSGISYHQYLLTREINFPLLILFSTSKTRFSCFDAH